MNDNDWFFETFHDDADEPLGLERGPEIAVLIMLIVAGVVSSFALAFNLGVLL